MIVANPWGEWVRGAHEGIGDALALRRGADESAAANYGLSRAQQFDPYNLQELQAKAREGNVNANIAEQYGLPMAQAHLAQNQFKVPFEAANYGVLGPLFQQLHNYDPNTVYSREGGMQTMVPGPDGQPIPYTQSISNVRSPGDMQTYLRMLQQQLLNEYRAGRLDISRENEARLEGRGTGVSNSNSIFGSGIPGVKALKAPATTNPTGQFDYGINAGVANPPSNDLGQNVYGDVTNPVKAGSGGGYYGKPMRIKQQQQD